MRSGFRVGLVSLALVACGGDDEEELLRPSLPAVSFDYTTLALPQRLQNIGNRVPADNPVTNPGATLGRVLFFDKHLSRNDTTACGTCHLQAKAFTDGRARSLGFAGQETRRNALSVVNLRFELPRGALGPLGQVVGQGQFGGFFWDLRTATLEEVVLLPIADPVELGNSLTEIQGKLQSLDYYPPLFQAAFGSPQVTTQGIARALSQFLRSIVSLRARYDVGLDRVNGNFFTDFDNFTEAENRGKREFFRAGCAVCHASDMARSVAAFNNGLDAATTSDRGLGEPHDLIDPSTGLDRFDALFKAPSLRNAELTAPFMHDGRLATLEEVVEHYNSQVQAHPNLTAFLQDPNGEPHRLNLTAQQKSDLVVFLKTLTDHELIADPKFSDPFHR